MSGKSAESATGVWGELWLRHAHAGRASALNLACVLIAVVAIIFPSGPARAADWRDLERTADLGEGVVGLGDAFAAVGSDGPIFLSSMDSYGYSLPETTSVRRFDPIELVPEALAGLPTDARAPLPICTFSDVVGVVVAYMVNAGERGGELYLQRYASTTTPSGPPILVSTQTSGDLSAVALDCEADGGVTVAWQTKSGEGPSYEAVARSYDAGGAPVSAELAIVGPTSTPVRPLDIARLADGALVATWVAGCPYPHAPDCNLSPLPMGPDGSFGAVVARVIPADGSAPPGEFIVNTTLSGRQGVSSGFVMPAANGGFVIGWDGEGGRDDQAIWGRSFSALGSPLGGEIALSAIGSDYASHPWLSGDPRTGYAVVWRSLASEDNSANVEARRFDQNGQALGPSFRVNLIKSGERVDQEPRAAASSPEGDLIVFWDDSREDTLGVVVRRVSRSEPACPIAPASCVPADRASLFLGGTAGEGRLGAEVASDFLPPLAPLGAAGLGGLTACVFAGSGVDSTLLAHATIPADPRCREGSCWQSSATGFSYADRLGQLGPVRQAAVRERPSRWWPAISPGSVRITARGSGVIDAVDLADVAAPLRLEVHGSDGQCWRAELLDMRATGGGIRADLG